MTEERDILLKFLQSETTASSWLHERDVGWRNNSTEDVCTWDGITCNASDKVHSIDLKGTDYSGTIPPEIGSLDNLAYLYLSGNNFHGNIPDSLTLPTNQLVHFDVSDNIISGQVPIFQSPLIQVVNLSRNNLTGIISDEIGGTGGGGEENSSLRVFDLKYNRVSGTIPKSFGDISTNLMELDLSNNKLVGTIPETLGNLLKMEGLFLSNNKLHGSIPLQLLHGDMEQLKQIFVHGNLLSGTVPIGLADLPNLTNLFIDDNKFTGTIPPELCDLNLNEVYFQSDSPPAQGGDEDYDDDDMGGQDDYLESNPASLADDVYQSKVYLKKARMKSDGTAVVKRSSAVGEQAEPDDLSNNDKDDLQAQIAALKEEIELIKKNNEDGLNRRELHGSDRSLLDLETERTGCNSIACPVGYRSSENDKDGVFPCVKCEYNFGNLYLGSTQCHELNQRLVLSHFYFATNGKEWVGDYKNWDNYDKPLCEWEGVGCNANNNIVKIELPNSNLRGTISEDIGFLRHLAVLDLSGNHLTGNIPSELYYAPLEDLDISGNMLTGFVPPHLCKKAGINSNGQEGKFYCSNIACPTGTYSSIGRMSVEEDCINCDSDQTSALGATTCVDMMDFDSVSSSSVDGFGIVKSGEEFGVVLLGMFGIALACSAFYIILNTKWRKKDDWAEKYGGKYGGKSTKNMNSDVSTNLAPRGTNNTLDAFSTGTFAMSAVEVKVQDHWNTGKDSTKEVWLDVPKIHS